MRRILLNLREEDVVNADRMAGQLGVSRSEVVRRALASFAGDPVIVETEEQRVARVRKAIEGMEEFRKELAKDPDWKPMEIIRAWRERGRRF